MFKQTKAVSMDEIEAILAPNKEEIEPANCPEPNFYFEPNGVPVFTPNYDTFKDFYKFIRSIEKHGHRAGLVKVIPPKEWLDQQNTSLEKLQKMEIVRPIKQSFNCGGLPVGAHRQLNIETKKKSFSGPISLYSTTVV
jgi:hypothetical protein